MSKGYSRRPSHRTYQAKRGSRNRTVKAESISSESMKTETPAAAMETAVKKEEIVITEQPKTKEMQSSAEIHAEEKNQIREFLEKAKSQIGRPFSRMKQEAETEGRYTSSHLMMIAVKDFLICAVFTILNVMAINSYQFSFVRMLFTDGVWLYLRMLLLVAGFEGALYLSVYAVNRFFKLDINMDKWIRVYSCLCYPAVAAYLIAFALYLFGFAVGTAGLLAAFAFNLILTVASAEMTAEMNLYSRLSLAAALCFFDTLCFWLWLAICAQDMLKIANTIIRA